MGMRNLIRDARRKLLGGDQAKRTGPDSKYVSGDTLSKVAKAEYDPNKYCLRATRTAGDPSNSPGR